MFESLAECVSLSVIWLDDEMLNFIAVRFQNIHAAIRRLAVDDAVISASVVEHIDPAYHRETVAGIHDSLVVGGYSIHAIDVTRRGVNGFLEKTIEICESWLKPMKSMVDE